MHHTFNSFYVAYHIRAHLLNILVDILSKTTENYIMETTNNLFDYLTWRGDLTFDQAPFCEIDGLICSKLAYIPYEHYFDQPGRQSHRLSSICDKLLSLPNIRDYLLEDQDDSLLLALSKAPRYSSIKIYDYVSIFDSQTETQFSACCLKLSPELIVVSFRGTDSTIVGWKEDFNLSFISPLRSQELATTYLNDMASKHTGSIIVTGHSKGGNLAIYGGIYTTHHVQNRIKRIYAYDSPGFPEHVINSSGYRKIYKRIESFVPQGSMVGMLLGHKEKYQIIHSSAAKMREQHFLYSWDVIGSHFVYEQELFSRSVYFECTMRQWLECMSPAEIEGFIESLYLLFENVDDTTLSEMRTNWVKNSRAMLTSLKNLDKSQKQEILSGLSSLYKIAKDQLISNAKSALKRTDSQSS